jgi:DNA-binding transcriptional regulator YhcF (GntR family)
MILTVELQSSISLDDQIRNQLREMIAVGVLAEGQALPSVRQLASDLAVHFNTVARAYRRLQDEGLLVIGHGRGVFVKAVPRRVRVPAREARESLGGRLRQIFVDARLIGLTPVQTRDLVLGELEQFTRKERS